MHDSPGSLPLTREVAFAKQMTEGENEMAQIVGVSLPQSASLTAPSSEGANANATELNDIIHQ